MSSSAIGFTTLSSGPVGPTGSMGPTGPTGPTGSTFGATGATGPLAPHISNISFYGAGATVLLSDGVELTVLGAFGGLTAIEHTTVDVVDRLAENTDVTTFSFLQSGNGTSSFVMKGLSASGSLVITEDAEAIYINSIYTPASGAADSASLTDNTLIYLKTSNQISSTTIGITSGTFYDGVLNFERSSSPPSFSKILPRAKVKYVAPTHKTDSAQPVVLNLDDAGSFYIRTPNGISAFNGTFKPSEIVSFTLITESDDIWNFPANTYFEDGENYLTCGKSVLNITSFDQGASWYAVVAARGVDTTKETCELRGLFGSCCYSGPSGQNCLDYASKNQCDVLSGTFSPLQSCNSACGSTLGVCCSNGQCIENTNYAECIAFGGNFLFGVTCGSFVAIPDGTNLQRLCFDECLGTKVSCCKNGECLGDEFTKIECEEILGGLAFDAPCSSVDCCEQNIKVGACCKDAACSQKTLTECNVSGGVFMGAGEICESVNCACIGTPGPPLYGTCCKCNGEAIECSITLQVECTTNIWTANENLTSTSSCPSESFSDCTSLPPAILNCVGEQGTCCYYDVDSEQTACYNTSNTVCDNFNGVWTQGVLCSSSQCDPCTSCPDKGGPCPDCPTPTPGVCCNCADPITPCIQTDDISTCLPGYTPTATSAVCADDPCRCTSTGDCESIRIEESTTRCVDLSADTDPSIISRGNTTRAYSTSTDLYDNTAGNILNTHVSLNSMDYYIDVTGPGFHTSVDGNDLQFCFSIDTSGMTEHTTQKHSFKLYLLRTWYPKNFARNYMAEFNLTYRDVDSGTDFPVTPTTSDEANELSTAEISYWNTISVLYPDYDGDYNYLPYGYLNTYIKNNGQDAFYHITNEETNIAFRTDDLRKELNCPLYGINSRGKGIYDGGSVVSHNNGNSISLLSGSSAKLNKILNIDADNSNTGNVYPAYYEYPGSFFPENSARYYHSDDIGLRYRKVTTNTVPSSMTYSTNYNKILYQAIDAPAISEGLTYNNTSSAVVKSPYLLFTKTIPTDITDNQLNHTFTYGADTYNTYKFSGYSDLGVSIRTTGSVTHTITGNESIGFYAKNAILNNFSNGWVGNNIDSSTGIGHPLTMDYAGDYVWRNNSVEPGWTDTLNGIISSPLRKTRKAAIILESPTLTNGGTEIIYSNAGVGLFAYNELQFTEKQVNGVFADPRGSENPAITTITSELSSNVNTKYNFCVKLKNYKQYMVTQELIDAEVQNPTEQLLIPSNSSEPNEFYHRFVNHINKLRMVIFTNAHEPTMIGITYSSADLLGTSTNTDKSLVKLSESYLSTELDINSGTLSNSYILRFGAPDRCDPTQGLPNISPCVCSLEAPNYVSNFYCVIPYVAACHGMHFDNSYCNDKIITTSFGNGLGSQEFCSCGAGCAPNEDNINWQENCGYRAYPFVSVEDFGQVGEKPPFGCSCKGESFVAAAACPTSNNPCPPGYANGCISCSSFAPGALIEPILEEFRLRGVIAIYDSAKNNFIIRMKPVELRDDDGVLTVGGYYDGIYYWFANGLRYGGCDDPVSTTPGGSANIFFRRSVNCMLHRCIFSDKSCNYGSTSIDNDLITAYNNIFSAGPQNRSCVGFGVSDLLSIYPIPQCPGGCPEGSFDSTFKNKSIPVGDGTFVCISLDCSVIDSTLYQDCSPS